MTHWTPEEEKILIDATAKGYSPTGIVARNLLPERSVKAVTYKSVNLRKAGRLLPLPGAKWTQGEDETLISTTAQGLLPQDIIDQNLLPGRSAKSIVYRTNLLRQTGMISPYRGMWTQAEEQILINDVDSGMSAAEIVTGNVLPVRSQRSVEDKIRALRQAGKISALAAPGPSKPPEAPWNQHEEEFLIDATAKGWNASDIAKTHVLQGRAARPIAEKVSSLRSAGRIPILPPAGTMSPQTQHPVQGHQPPRGRFGALLQGHDTPRTPYPHQEQFAFEERQSYAPPPLQQPQFFSGSPQQPQYFSSPPPLNYVDSAVAPALPPGDLLAGWSDGEKSNLCNAVVLEMTPEEIVEDDMLPNKQLVEIQMALAWLRSMNSSEA